MKPTAGSGRIFVLSVSLLAVAALFLPFTFDVSPWAVVKGGHVPNGFILLAAPFFLAVAIVAWEVRRVVKDRLTSGEIAVAYGLSIAAMLSVLGFVILLVKPEAVTYADIVIPTILWSMLAGANMLLLMRNRRAGLSREAIGEAFMLGGYLLNAIFNLMLWSLDGWFSNLNIGAYLIAVVCVGYATAIFLISRANRPAHRPPWDRP